MGTFSSPYPAIGKEKYLTGAESFRKLKRDAEPPPSRSPPSCDQHAGGLPWFELATTQIEESS
jgi:hypothetical protein